jgi:hypothetical protein
MRAYVLFALCSIFIFCLELYTFGSVTNENGSEKQIEAKKDDRVMKSLEDMVSSVEGRADEAIKTLIEIDRDQVCMGLAYALQQSEPYRKRALSIIRYNINDKRLSPFVGACIKDYASESKGELLMYAVSTAKELGDPSLIGVIIENALDSKYVKGSPSGNAMRTRYTSVFARCAQALFVMTNGEIGKKNISTKNLSDEERERLIAEWKAWWEENKPQENGEEKEK